jgi:hypothetical protein
MAPLSGQLNSLGRREDAGRRVRVVARVLLSVVGIIYVFSFWRILDFTWGLDPPVSGTFLCWGLIATLLLRAVGYGGWWLDRLLSVLHFAGAYKLFSGCLPYETVNLLVLLYPVEP